MKNQLKKLYMLLVIIATTSCTKDIEQNSQIETKSKVNEVINSSDSKIGNYADLKGETKIYIGGYTTKQETGKKIATIWNGGTLSYLTNEGLSNSEVKSVFITNNNVYAVGYIEKDGLSTPTLWTNGVRTNLSEACADCSANSVYVKNGIVHIAGTVKVNNESRATYWRNGVIFTSANPSNAYAVTVTANNTVFLGGNRLFGNYDRPVAWNITTGNALNLGNNAGKVRAFVNYNISPTPIIIGGFGTLERYSAYLWGNNGEIQLQQPYDNGNYFTSEARGAFSDGVKVFSCGFRTKLGGNPNIKRARYWENQIGYELTNTTYLGISEYDTWANDIKKTGNTLFTVGTAKFGNSLLAKLWVNNDEYYLTNNLANSEANSIFIN